MNWVGGARRRVGLQQNEKKTQKEYFERKRHNKKIRAFQSPERKYGVSQDLLALHTINIAYSGMPFDKKLPEKRYVRKVNIDQSKLFSREIQAVELPHSPVQTSSQLNLGGTDLSILNTKPPVRNKSSNGKEALNENHGLNDAFLSPSFPQIFNFPVNEPHQSKSKKLFNTTLQNKGNESTSFSSSSLSLLDSCSMDMNKTKRSLDRYQPSFLSSMDVYPSMSQESLALPPGHHLALPESRPIPMASISDVYNKRESKWREHTKSVHTATYIEEHQHCWQMATSQRSYISKNTPPFMTTLHQLQETEPYSYQQYTSAESSPEKYIAIPLGTTQQMYMPSVQAERVRNENEIATNTRDNFTDDLTFQMSRQTSDFWQIPVFGDFVKEMKIKQNQTDGLQSTSQLTDIEREEDVIAKNYSRENRIANLIEKNLKTIQNYAEDQEDPVISEHIFSQMSDESRPGSRLVDVSVQTDEKGSSSSSSSLVNDANTSPIIWPQNHQVTQCDEEEFQLEPTTEETHKDLLQIISEENKILQEASKDSEVCYRLRSRSAAKCDGQK